MEERQRISLGFAKPRPAQMGLMIGIGALWLVMAIGMNWTGAGLGELATKAFYALVATPAILHGQVWRVLTNVFLHQPSGNGSAMHLLTTLLGIYFLGTSLEERWGSKRFLYFVVGSAWFASFLQFALSSLIPQLQTEFYGGLAMVDAVAVAWALSFKDRQVNLMFVLPVSGRTLILFTLGLNILYVLAVEQRHEGIITPFGGMLGGYLFGDGSPLRRFYLATKFKRLQKESASLRALRTQSAARLRVIEGGASEKRPDKSMLN